jgi:hypothetical protein
MRYVVPFGPGTDFDIAFATTSLTSFSVIPTSLNLIDGSAGNSRSLY